MLRKTLEDLDKMHCGTEQKAEEDKGDKKSKKPAHGMVIVIGSRTLDPVLRRTESEIQGESRPSSLSPPHRTFYQCVVIRTL